MKSACGQELGSCGLPGTIYGKQCSPSCKKTMEKKIVTIAFPSKGVTGPDFAHMLKLLQLPPDCAGEILSVSGADTAVARNTLAEDFRGDYIFFIDDDVLAPMDTIIKLIAHDKDIVSGLYFARQEPHFPQLFTKNKKSGIRYDSVYDIPEGLTEVDACGAGCMLIKKEVFQVIKKPYFQFIPKGEDTPRKGEDFFFCEKIKKEGIKIYADPSVVCQHMATRYIGPQHWDISKQRIEELKTKLGPKKFEEFKKQQWDN